MKQSLQYPQYQCAKMKKLTFFGCNENIVINADCNGNIFDMDL